MEVNQEAWQGSAKDSSKVICTSETNKHGADDEQGDAQKKGMLAKPARRLFSAHQNVSPSCQVLKATFISFGPTASVSKEKMRWPADLMRGEQKSSSAVRHSVRLLTPNLSTLRDAAGCFDCPTKTFTERSRQRITTAIQSFGG